jgi:hypothetical protein
VTTVDRAQGYESGDIELVGKDGSEWKHDYIPLNAAAIALKHHRKPEREVKSSPHPDTIARATSRKKISERLSSAPTDLNEVDPLKLKVGQNVSYNVAGVQHTGMVIHADNTKNGVAHIASVENGKSVIHTAQFDAGGKRDWQRGGRTPKSVTVRRSDTAGDRAWAERQAKKSFSRLVAEAEARFRKKAAS